MKKVKKYSAVVLVLLNFFLFLYINQRIINVYDLLIYNGIFIYNATLSALSFSLGATIYLKSDKKNSEVYWYLILSTTVGWFIQSYVIPEDILFVRNILTIVSYCLPIGILLFYISYTREKSKKFIFSILPIFLILAMAIGYSVTLPNLISQGKEELLILLAFFLCFLLFIRNRYTKISVIKYRQKELLTVFFLTFIASVICIYSPVISPVMKPIYASFCMVVMLLLISLLMINKHSIKVIGSMKDFIYSSISVMSLVILAIVSNVFIFKLQFKDILFFSVMLFVIYFITTMIKHAQFNLVHERLSGNRAFEYSEKKKLQDQMSIDDYIFKVGNLLGNLINESIDPKGSLILWREQDNIVMIDSSGSLQDIKLNSKIKNDLIRNKRVIKINHERYQMSQLVSEETLVGWLILDIGKLDNESKRALFGLQAIISDFLLATEQMGTKKMTSEPYYFELYQESLKDLILRERTEKLKKEMSYYLHDDILQGILALKNYALAAAKSGKSEKETLLLIGDELNNINDKIRDKMFDLYPSSLIDLPFSQSVSIMVNKIESDFSNEDLPEIKLDMEQDLQASNQLKYIFFRIIKELVVNTLKHAEAHTLNISVLMTVNTYIIKIEDDGKGFDINKLDSGPSGFGLLSISQEVNSLNGELKITTGENKGTTFVIQVPREDV